MIAIAMLALGAALLLVPLLGLVPLHPIAGSVLMFLGGALLLIGGYIAFYSKFYRRASANEAFVRTGQGGTRVILDSGSLVIPFFHQTVPVSLETMKLEVERRGPDALITKDNLRVDVKGEFYLKVKALEEDILNAARSLGEKSVQASSVSTLVFEKLVSALRSVAATKDLIELHTQRDAFASSVLNLVVNDLQQNGLTLESVTISRLDQTAQELLSDTNIFDAQGKKKITEITQAALIERNRIERNAEREIAVKDVETRQQVLEQERMRAEAEANQAKEVANVQAQRRREQEEFAIVQDRGIKEAEIQRDLAVQAAAIDRDKALIARKREMQEADIDREKAIAAADIARTQALSVQERQKEAAVAEQEALRAKAEEAALKAQAAREAAEQEVIKVQQIAEAEREAKKKLIAAQQIIDQDKIKRQTEAEVAAFAQVKQAEATQASAEKEATARLRLAQAEAQAKEMNAQGERALQMVSVDVAKEQVAVEQARVEVERQALENKQTFSEAALSYELQKLQIEAGRDVQVKMAQSIGEFMSKGQFTIYGDPSTMSQMMTQYTRGLSMGSLVNGLMAGTPDGAKAAIAEAGREVASIVERFTGRKVSPEQAAELASRVIDGAYKDETSPREAKPAANGLTYAAGTTAAVAGVAGADSDGGDSDKPSAA
ncbi:MAG TPA: SPFH domain-containing protein [Armatimonadaceae bacterium]|nr:SPFH domain-containing protein [Armatimonadaceae bacterium]